jgi:hypothetical protein
MEQHNKEQHQILNHVPGDRGISSGSGVDFEHCYQKPGPVQKHINARETEQADRSLAIA